MAVDKLVDSAALESGLTSVADAIRSKTGTSGSIAFPEGMVSAINGIQDRLFYSLFSRTLSGVFHDSNVRTVGYYTLAYTPVTEVSFPNCTTISDWGFYYNTSLQRAYFDNVQTIRRSAFYLCYNMSYISMPKVRTIGESAFNGCSSLTSITAPELSVISDGAFNACYNLSQVNFASVRSVGDSAFRDCKALKSISLPLCSVIDSYAFAYCSSLLAASLPACTRIGNYAFEYCSALQSIYIETDTVPTLENSFAFFSTPIFSGSGKIYVKLSMAIAFRSASQWSYFASKITYR